MRLLDPREVTPAGHGAADHAGRRDRRAALRRHPRPGLPPPLRGRRGDAASRPRGRPSSGPAWTPLRCRPMTTSCGPSCAWPTLRRRRRQVAVSFLWPQALVAAAPGAGRPRRPARHWSGGGARPRPAGVARRDRPAAAASAAACRELLDAARLRRPGGRAGAAAGDGGRAHGTGHRWSWPSTSRPAWPPRTSRRRAWPRPRRPRRRSSRRSRRTWPSAWSPSAMPASRTQAPTKDQATVLAAIDRLAPQKGTSHRARASWPSLKADPRRREAGRPPTTTATAAPAPTASPAPVPPGERHVRPSSSCSPTARTTRQPDPLTAAQAAADQGVRIDTVGIGTRRRAADLDLDGFPCIPRSTSRPCSRSRRRPAGTYFTAADTGQLSSVYAELASAGGAPATTAGDHRAGRRAGLACFSWPAPRRCAWSGRLP